MKLTKEDLMKLSKERLVELLLQTQDTPDATQPWRVFPYPITDNVPCWAPGGWCSNPQRDCIDCPGKAYPGQTLGTSTAQTNLKCTAFPGNSELQGNTEKTPLND